MYSIITTPSLGNGGRLANQIMAYMSLTGIANKYGKTLVLPEKWKYAKYFNGCNDLHDFINAPIIKEKEFHYTDYPELKSGNHSLKGYFQSFRYWEHIESEIREKFSWDESGFPKHNIDKNGISIHIRRGDYVNNQAYAQLGIRYYIQALFQNFPDWQKRKIYIYSDNIEYCKIHFGSWDNFIFSEGKSDIEDLYLMSQCKNLILSNSSYSWLGAYFAETIHGECNVIRPKQHFSGSLSDLSTKDFYPKKWVEFISDAKINLRDVTFTIPIFYDHPDRKKNLDLCVCMIQHYFDTKIVVMENKSVMFGYMSQWTKYVRSDHQLFHRTKMLNEMAIDCNTDFIFNWDADVIMPPMQILKAVYELRSGSDMVYPYNGQFARVGRIPFFKQLESSMDVGILSGTKLEGTRPNDKESFGGAVGWNRKKFFEAGGENENFISFGAEDYERYERASKLGFKIKRTKGCLFHINHWVGVNSSTRNPYFNHNRAEYEKVKAMSKKELKEYIKTWN